MAGTSGSGISGDKTEFSRGASDFWVVKLNQDGQILWQRTIGGDQPDRLDAICITPDNGYLLGGSSVSGISGDKTVASKGGGDFWIVKLNSEGDIEWQKAIGGSSNELLSALEPTPDGGYIMGGYSISEISGDKTEGCRGMIDFWVVKIDSNGDIEWDKTLGGEGPDWAHSVAPAEDGGYFVAGFSASGISGDKTEALWAENNDYWVVKLDAAGAIEWQKALGGTGTDTPQSIVATQDGGCLVGGSSASGISGNKTEDKNGTSDFWIVKLTGSGSIDWQQTIGGSSSETLNKIISAPGGGFLLAGRSSSPISGDKTEASRGEADFWLVRIDEIGNITGQATLGGSASDTAQAVTYSADGKIVVGGNSLSPVSGEKSESNRGESDYWVVKFNTGNLSVKHVDTVAAALYPNPTDGVINLMFQEKLSGSLDIYDVSGKSVKTAEFSDTDNFQIKLEGQPGLYFIKVTCQNSTATLKVTKL